jgi:fatty acid desaturase
MHRYQHIYIIVGYAIYWLSEIASQVRYVMTGSMPYSQDSSKASRRAMLFLSEKAMCAVVLLPYFLIGGGGWRIIWLLLIAGTLGSIYAGLVVGVGHINIGLNPTEQPPNGAKWIGYVLSSTASFSVDNRVAGWLTGGLTLHAAHHLRPLACRRELRSLHSELKRQSMTGQALIEFASFARALSGHFAALRLWGSAFPTATKQTASGYVPPAASLDPLAAAQEQ